MNIFEIPKFNTCNITNCLFLPLSPLQLVHARGLSVWTYQWHDPCLVPLELSPLVSVSGSPRSTYSVSARFHVQMLQLAIKNIFKKDLFFFSNQKLFFKYLAHITQRLKGLEQLTAPNHDASKGDPIKFHPQLKAHKAYVKLPSCSKSNDIFLSWLSILER